jgi:hypothetical protein
MKQTTCGLQVLKKSIPIEMIRLGTKWADELAVRLMGILRALLLFPRRTRGGRERGRCSVIVEDEVQ